MSEFKLYVYDKITNTLISGYNGIDITGNSYTITGLTDNTEYTIKMRRYDENGNLSNISKTKNVITDNATIPNILVTNENFARFEVYFDSITNASGYLVYLSKDGEPVDNYNPYFSDTNDFAITGLIPESTYSFYVVTAYGGKTSQPSDSYTAITEAVNLDNPSNLVISGVDYRNSTITWDSVLDATHYDVYIENVAVTGMNAYWDTISATGETSFPASITGSTSFTFDNGVPQQPFRYYIKAKYYEYESNYVQSASGSFSIVPDVTALEETNVSTSGFTANWTKVLDIGSARLSGYYVYLYNSSNVLQNTIVLTNQDGSLNNSFMSGSSGYVALTSGMVSPTGMNETMYILNSSGGYETNLVILDNTTYKYKVKAHYNYNASANFSNEISVTTDTVITIPSNLKIDLNFGSNSTTDISNNSNNATLYNGASLTAGGIQTGDTHHLLLDGTNDYAQVAYNSNYNNADFTLEMIFSLNAIEFLMPLLTRYDLSSDTTNTQFALLYTNSGLECQLFDETYNQATGNNSKYAIARSNAANNLVINTKYVLQFSWNQTTKTAIMKLDNTLISLTDYGFLTMASLNINSTVVSPLLIGAFIDPFGVNSGNSAYFPNLKIARTRYWTKALTSSEMTDSYNIINA